MSFISTIRKRYIWDQSTHAAGIALALHVTDPDLIPECWTRSKSLPGVSKKKSIGLAANPKHLFNDKSIY